MSDTQIVEEIIETSKKFARNFVFYGTSPIPEDPEFKEVVVRWQMFQNTLSKEDRNVAVSAFREVLGEE